MLLKTGLPLVDGAQESAGVGLLRRLSPALLALGWSEMATSLLSGGLDDRCQLVWNILP